MLEIEKSFEQTSYGAVMLVVILPEGELLDVALKTTAHFTNASTVMCHQANWPDWLCRLDTAVFNNLIVILPFRNVNTLGETLVWNCTLRRRLAVVMLV